MVKRNEAMCKFNAIDRSRGNPSGLHRAFAFFFFRRGSFLSRAIVTTQFATQQSARRDECMISDARSLAIISSAH